MEHPHEPLNAINDWQIWYRKNHKDTMTKTTKEVLGVYPVPEWNSFWEKPLLDSECKAVWKEKAITYFSDTLAEFANELTAEEFYDAFLTAAKQQAEIAKKEYNKTQRLVDLLTKNEKTKTN